MEKCMAIEANRPMDATKFSDCGKSLLSWEGEDTAPRPSSRIGVSIKQDGAYASLAGLGARQVFNGGSLLYSQPLSCNTHNTAFSFSVFWFLFSLPFDRSHLRIQTMSFTFISGK